MLLIALILKKEYCVVSDVGVTPLTVPLNVTVVLPVKQIIRNSYPLNVVAEGIVHVAFALNPTV